MEQLFLPVKTDKPTGKTGETGCSFLMNCGLLDGFIHIVLLNSKGFLFAELHVLFTRLESFISLQIPSCSNNSLSLSFGIMLIYEVERFFKSHFRP